MNEPPSPEVAIFAAALELPADERGAYLDKACAGDTALLRQVEALLRVHDDAGDFFEKLSSVAQPAPVEGAMPGSSGTTRLPSIANEKPGDRIGRYKLLQQIGEGGCGVVYMAEQEEPVRRRVALKVIKLGMDTRSVIARFEVERQALALMDHPNIAKVLDAGATDTGRPYFVMELVRGIKVTDYCDENNLSTVARLELFIQVCEAVQHAHQKGIIHRDIKPSNLLVADHDGKPVPKIIDFGIAKATTDQRLTDKTLFTAFEQFIGTPAYMSPEQARLSGLDIDTRSDIYSLGVLLYELLTGKTPFEARRLQEAGLDEIRRIIREEEPLRPSTKLQTLEAAEQTTVAKQRQSDPPKLAHLIRGDLDWIVMKCLEKDRSRRYEAANSLAADVKRHLSNEPVLARPPSKLYRVQKLILRNRLASLATLAVLLSLIACLIVSTLFYFKERRALYASYLSEARALRTSGQGGRRFASLEAARKAAAIHPDIAVRNEVIASLALSDLRVSREVILKGHVANNLVGFDFNLEKYMVGDAHGNITVRAVKDDTVLAVLPAPGFKVRRIRELSPDSRFLRVAYESEGGNYCDWVWDLKLQTAVLRDLPSGKVTESEKNLAGNFSSDSRFFARCGLDGTLSIHELNSGKEVKRLPGARIFNTLILSPGNTWLACASESDPVVEIREVESGREVATLACPSGVSCMAWSPDGKRLATGCRDYRIYIWDVDTVQRQATLEGHTSQINSVAFNHAGNLLATSSWDGLIRLWNSENGSQIARRPGGSWQLQFSEDDRQLLGWSYVTHFGSLEVADSQEFHVLTLPRPDRSSGPSPEFSADGRILVANAGDTVSFWNAFSGQQLASLPLRYDTHVFEADGQGLLITDWKEGVGRCALERMGDSASFAYRLGKPQRLYEGSGFYQGALSRDGRYLALNHASEGEALILDLKYPSAKPVVLRPDPPYMDRIAISPDGRWVTTASWHTSDVKIWDAHSGDLVRMLPMPGRTSACFSPDGRWLATSTKEYQLWEVGSWRPKGPSRPGCDVPEWNFTAFSPDGLVMARTLDGTKVQLLESSTERPLATLEANDSIGLSVFEFSPDGSHLAVAQWNLQMQVWDLRLIRQDLREMHLDWDMPPFSSGQPLADTRPVTLEIESDVASQSQSLFHNPVKK